jgi:hypothetical protein
MKYKLIFCAEGVINLILVQKFISTTTLSFWWTKIAGYLYYHAVFSPSRRAYYFSLCAKYIFISLLSGTFVNRKIFKIALSLLLCVYVCVYV